jgi:acyl-CoA thioesterase-1
MIRSCTIFGMITQFSHAKNTPGLDQSSGVAEKATYLADVAAALRVDWPGNRFINIVCFGHSVPAGYAKTPETQQLAAYPNLLRVGLANKYHHCVLM